MKKFLKLDWDTILLITLIALLAAYYTRLIPVGYADQALFAVSVFAILPVIWSAGKSLRQKQISVDLLASIALAASLLAGEWASAAFINLMLTSARIFGAYTENKARSAVQGLLKLRPQKVKIKKGEKIIIVSPEQVGVGDLVVVESGDRIPVDGRIIQGEATINQSSLTGESMPIFKKQGDAVYSSTLNESGSLIVKTEKVGNDTTLEKIINLVQSSQKDKAVLRTTADRFATWYIVLTLVGSVVAFALFKDFRLLLALLLIACADDIAVAIPMAFLAAIGYAARRGVIIRGSRYLEGLARVKTIIVDKTGTLTRGKLKVQGAKAYPHYTMRGLMSLGATAESISEHPIAKAIVQYAESHNVKVETLEEFKEMPGKGVAAVYNGKKLIAGNLHFMAVSDARISKPKLAEIMAVENQGFSVNVVVYDEKLVGFFACADELRPNIKESIIKLKALGVKLIVMLTGDNERVAERIAKEVGISQFHANLSPAEKVRYVKKYVTPGSTVMMVGDGVNDAASLALADIGVAMGAIGSDAAIEAADIALMRDDFSEIPEMIALSRYTNKIAHQDFWTWGIVNVIGLTLVFLKVLGPEGASVYNFITDFIPLLNSLRLFNLHLKL